MRITIYDPCQELSLTSSKRNHPREFEVTFCVRGVISPLLANLYLHSVDLAMAEAGYRIIRYADDFVILCQRQAEAQSALDLVSKLIEQKGLKLHPDKTKLVDLSQRGGAFDFLGYRFYRYKCYPRKKSTAKLKDSIRQKRRGRLFMSPGVASKNEISHKAWRPRPETWF